MIHKELHGSYGDTALKGAKFLCTMRIEHAAFFTNPSEIEKGVGVSHPV